MILAERGDGKWAARQVGLVVPRQNGKGAILEALELFWLFLSGESLILHSAHEFKTAKEAFLRVKQKVESTPDLHRRVLRYLQNNNDMSIELRTGRRLRFVARTGGSGRGFTGDKIVLDEAYNLPDKAVSALQPTMSAIPNPQVIITSSAPLLDEASAFLRRLCKRGREGSPSLAYLEWCAEPDDDHDDPQVWASANPGYPFRIDDEAIQSERDIMLDADFARERLGLWAEDEDIAEWVIPEELWSSSTNAATVDLPAQFALAVADDRSWSAFGSAGAPTVGDHRVQVELVEYRSGTDWVVAFAEKLTKDGSKLGVAKGSPAASLIPELQQAGISVEQVTVEDQAKYAGQFYDAATSDPQALGHRDQAALTLAVKGTVKRPVGEAFAWSQRKSTTDICPLVSVTLAAGMHTSLAMSELEDEMW